MNLNRLLEHASSLTEASEVGAQRDAVFANRMLLENPDPVAPLVDEIAAILRAILSKTLGALRDAFDSEMALLEASDGWEQISRDQREAVLAGAGLALPDPPDISGTDHLLAALNAQPLAGVGERIQALPAKGVAARRAIAEIIDPKPSVATISAPTATLKSESDVDNYLAAFRTKLMAHIDAGETVVT